MDQKSSGFWSKSEQKNDVSGVSSVSGDSCDSYVSVMCCPLIAYHFTIAEFSHNSILF